MLKIVDVSQWNNITDYARLKESAEGLLIKSSQGVDWYNGSTSYDADVEYNGVDVFGSGYHLFELVINGKNGSSSDFRALISYISLSKQGSL